MTNGLAQRVQNNVAARQQQGGAPSVEGAIKSMEKQFQLAMPKGVEAAQLVRDALTVVRNTPKLAECDPGTLLGSLMTCAQLGLRPGVGALGHAYILPMWSGRDRRFNAQFILGYQGMLELAQRSGQIESISARMVHENDVFEVEYGLEDKLVHKPVLFGSRGAVIGYYAVAKYTSGGHGFIFANRAEMEEHRDKFAMARKKDGTIVGPWAEHFDAMALKTTIRELSKYMPKSTELQNAIVADDSVRVDLTPTADLVQVSERPEPGEYTADPQQIEQAPEGVDTITGEVSDADKAWSLEKQEA